MYRMMGLLAAPLADWQALSYEQYAEWVAVRFKVGLLQAHAQVWKHYMVWILAGALCLDSKLPIFIMPPCRNSEPHLFTHLHTFP